MIEAKLTMTLYRRVNLFVRSSAFKSAGIYTFSNFFAKSVGFLLLFIYSNPYYLSVDENGLLSLFSSSIMMFMPFLALGTVHSTNVEFFKLEKNEFKNFFTSGFVVPIIMMVIGFLCMYYFRKELNHACGFPIIFIFIVPILTFLNFCNDQFVSLIRNNDEPVTYFKVSMLRLIIEAGLSLILVVNFSWGWKGRVAGMVIACFVLFFAALNYFRKKNYLFGKIKKHFLKGELLYALPIIIMQVSFFCLYSSDKFFLSYFSSNTDVGIYGYACAFAAILTIACSAVLSYVTPKVYLCLSEATVDYKQIRKYLIYYVGFCFATLVGIILITPILYKYFINSKYFPGLHYLFLIAIGYLFWNISSFFYSFMLFKKQKKKIILLALLSIVVSLTSNYLFIKHWSSMGAAISICVSYFLIFIITLISFSKDVRLLFKINKMG